MVVPHKIQHKEKQGKLSPQVWPQYYSHEGSSHVDSGYVSPGAGVQQYPVQQQHMPPMFSANSAQNGTHVTSPQQQVSTPSSSNSSSTSESSAPKSSKPPLKRKRVAVSKACYHCRRAHAKCSDARPCTRCVRRGVACVENEDDVPEAQLASDHQRASLPSGVPRSTMPALTGLGMSALQTHANPSFISNGRYLLNTPQHPQQPQQLGSTIEAASAFLSQHAASRAPTSFTPTATAYSQPFSALTSTLAPSQHTLHDTSASHLSVPSYPSILSGLTQGIPQGITANVSTSPLSLNMVSTMTQSITQQAQIIQQIVDKYKDQQISPPPTTIPQPAPQQPRERLVFQNNPFVQFFGIPGELCAIWKNDITTHNFTLLFASEEFCREMYNSSLRDIQGCTFTMEDIPSLVMGTYNLEVKRQDSPEQRAIEAYVEEVLQSLPNKEKLLKKHFSERIVYLRRRMVLAMRFWEVTAHRHNGIVYSHYRAVDEFTDEVTVNSEHLPKTFEIRDITQISRAQVGSSLKRISTALEMITTGSSASNTSRDGQENEVPQITQEKGPSVTTTSSTPSTSKPSPLLRALSRPSDLATNNVACSPFLGGGRSTVDMDELSLNLDDQMGLEDFDFFLV